MLLHYYIPGCVSEGIPPYSTAALPRSRPLEPTASVPKFGLRRFGAEARRLRGGSVAAPLRLRAGSVQAPVRPRSSRVYSRFKGKWATQLSGQVGSIADSHTVPV